MNDQKLKNEWLKEFQEFAQGHQAAPPNEVTERIMTLVQKELNPSPWKVFSKLALIHTAVGAFTLLICPQFGLGFFSGMGLMAIFMVLGEAACTVACGAFFVGTGLLVASLVLRSEELKVLRAHKLVQVGLLSLLSIGVFIALGAVIVQVLAVFWLLGSIIGGVLSLELVWKVRYQLRGA